MFLCSLLSNLKIIYRKEEDGVAKEYFELRHFSEVGNSPEFPKEVDYQGLEKGATIIQLDPYGFLFPYGDTSKKPPMYFHHSYLDKIRFNGVTEFGDDYLSHQHLGKHHDEMAQPETLVTKAYERVEDYYVLQTDEPYSQIKYFDDGTVTCKESNFLDLTFKPLKLGNIDYGNMFKGRFTVQQPCLLTGFYEGQPVIGMGSYDRTFAPAELFSQYDVMGESAYIYVVGHGVREDGRREAYMITIGLYGEKSNGVHNGYYWIDGEEPIVVTDATIDAEWVHLPYVDDGTVVYKDAVFKIGPKVIHFTGNWGTKGFTKEPRIERHGQSQVFGTWYEGDTPYKHKMYFGWGEHTGAYDHVIEAYGFKVID